MFGHIRARAILVGMPAVAKLGLGLRHAFPLFAEHDLFGKPVSTFPDHALASRTPVC
jgi:hypothetical protein